jgi:glyoxylase-like metal-dependent hydrolase (beta-lactamase superfamily II)
MSQVRIIRVLAPNPGPFTLEGTNTWIVGENPAFVIDPGPDDAAHLEAVARQAGPVKAILLTHHHPDHAPGSRGLSERIGAPVLAFRPEPGEARLRDGEVLDADTVRLRVIHAPGHTADHVVLFEEVSRALFTGDAVLGRGTSIIDPPEGDVAVYLRSLARMLGLDARVIYPGHGPAVWSPAAKIKEYVAHRHLREQQVVEELALGPRTPQELTEAIYWDVPSAMHPAAERSMLAHLLKLEREGRATRVGPRSEERFAASEPRACTRCGRPAAPGSSLCDRCRLSLLQENPSS